MTIDISSLPAPEVIEPVSYDTILADMLADLIARDATLANLLPSDPAYKILEVCAYREAVKSQEYNDRTKGLLLAFATGGNLDHIGVTYFRTQRLEIDPGDPSAVPPVPPTYESDTDYLERLLRAESAYSTAGPVDAYIYHAQSADGNVKDISVTSPSAVSVVVAVLSHTGDGTADAGLLSIIDTALADDVRPLTDLVTVQSAVILPYTINTTLTTYPGLDQETVRLASLASVTTWVDKMHRLGRDITLSGLTAAHMVDGVMDVTFNNTIGTDITANKVISATEAAYCTGITITAGLIDE
ncbi:MAG: baseplate J/gp47 family protein [Candidatus Pacearchaeota archaeon]|nr:baseplate J/gp47 family protein [Candidatus Pacearchaeota archaeon]